MSMLGKSLIHYEITAEIGKGGMGEVYQAKDTKLGRDVAIKVLPEEFALDTDRVARFQREAKLLASLNHPNIAAIYGLEESEGTHFLVMELIEGDTLRDRIKTGPIPVEEALKLALQMAEALEAAHEKGVIHRDLKPANIKVTPDGKVKILDFGLAKAYVGDQENMSPMDSPTISAAATQQGIILGTAAYMSPEQAKGKSVDKRADIWAFGCVLFEMLTGKSLFSGEDVSSTLARVLEREPDFSTLPQNLHSRIQFMLERCLRKDPKDRYSGISDARVDIQEVLADPSGLFAQPVATLEPKVKRRQMLLWASITVILIIIAGLGVWRLKPTEPKRVISFGHELPVGQQLISNLIILAVSPDGRNFVYSTNEGLYLRSIDKIDARHIPGTDTTSVMPFFSPDGQWIGYLSGSDMTLKKIAVRGEVAVTLCDVPSTAGGFSWSSDKGILHAVGNKIMRTSDDGGEWEPLIEEESGRLGSPQMLPGGKAVMFVNTSPAPYRIMVHSLKSGKSKVLLEGAYSARYIKTGHIVYGAEGNLYAVPFDIDTLERTGNRISIIKDVSSSDYFYDYDVSESGTLVYIPISSNQYNFVWVDREGEEETIAAEPNRYNNLKLSPDGTRLATSFYDSGNEDIWIWDFVGEKFTQTTLNETDDDRPVWTPDSRQIIYWSMKEDGIGIYRIAANGTGDVETINYEEGHLLFPWSLDPDGKILAITDVSNNLSNADIGTLLLEGDHARVMLLNEKYMETQPQISPKGHWIAYTSNESGKEEVYVRSFPDVDDFKEQISNDGGNSPLWSPNGEELFYRNGDAVIAVPIKSGANFEFGKPIILFERSYDHAASVNGYLWDTDGNRFLMVKNAASEKEANQPRINIVLNWFEELKQRVPVD